MGHLHIYAERQFYPNAFCLVPGYLVCLTLCDPMDCIPPGSSVHVVFQARMLQQVPISILQGTFPTRKIGIASPAVGWWVLHHCAPWKLCPVLRIVLR